MVPSINVPYFSRKFYSLWQRFGLDVLESSLILEYSRPLCLPPFTGAYCSAPIFILYGIPRRRDLSQNRVRHDIETNLLIKNMILRNLYLFL